MDKSTLYKIIDDNSQMLQDLSDKIWEYAELSMMEHKSTAAYLEILRAEGFNVNANLCGIATAFSASYGEGRPVIGLLGE